MITDLPFYVFLTFGIALVYGVIAFYHASNKSLKFLLAIIVWGALHSVLAITGFYEKTMTTPPRFIIVVVPLMMIVISSIFSRKMKSWLSTFDMKKMLMLHGVRIPVELVLYWLFLGAYVPQAMSFAGSNHDVLSGVTALILGMVVLVNKKVNRTLLWIWHIGSLLLLGNILVLAVLATPTVLQTYAFDQPNTAVMHFPFILLPSVIVPLVLISNIAGIIILLQRKEFANG